MRRVSSLALAVIALALASGLALPTSGHGRAPQAGPAECPDDYIEGSARGDVWRGTDLAEGYIGGRGDDLIDGAGGDDCLEGGRGSDTIVGGAGNDAVNDSSGRNQLAGLDGNNAISSLNLENDIVRCGAGFDRADVDEFDRVEECERVVRYPYVDAKLHLRWRVFGNGVVLDRVRVTRLRPGTRVIVLCRCFRTIDDRKDYRARKSVRLQALEGRLFRKGRGFSVSAHTGERRQAIIYKDLSFVVKRYRSPRRVAKAPFRLRVHCGVSGIMIDARRCR